MKPFHNRRPAKMTDCMCWGPFQHLGPRLVYLPKGLVLLYLQNLSHDVWHSGMSIDLRCYLINF